MKIFQDAGRGSKGTLFVSALMAAAVLVSCTCDEYLMPTVEDPRGQWISGVPFITETEEIPHDNRIFESKHFLVFSDASSDEVRIRYSVIAEQGFSELLEAFEIESGESLGIVDKSSKMTIYANRYRDILQQSFRYGFILYSEDSPTFLRWPRKIRERFRNEVKHETMHVLQYLLGVTYHRLSAAEMLETWIIEGLAEYVSGGAHPPITSLEEVTAWRLVEDHTNPISVHRWIDYPVPHERVSEYYPMFGLAVKYLLDPLGHGKTLLDMKAMLLELARGGTFCTEAFERYFGMTIEYYEDHFFDLISDYLRTQPLN